MDKLFFHSSFQMIKANIYCMHSLNLLYISGQNDDVVKLYDLTSLSREPHGNSEANPFVQPVALLLYRVAHAMSASKPTKKWVIYTIAFHIVSVWESNLPPGHFEADTFVQPLVLLLY